MVTFEQFVRPALLKMAGHTRWFRPVVRARTTERLEKRAGRVHFVRVALERRGGEILATPTGTQSSGVLSSMTRAAGLLIFPAEATRIEAESLAPVQVLDETFFCGEESGI
jgi:molybdopterin molybdotransferase